MRRPNFLTEASGPSEKIHRHIQALVDAGLVEPMDHKQRGVRLVSQHSEAGAERLPLLGTIAAGRPIEAVSD